ncbi:MAG: protein export chaperone SecB [Oceanospirillaceae bacterium]|nr:protein export chaperone SecB [Oceanospirillaceae bacterium]
MKEWNEVKQDFVPEGSLRDIYVEDVDVFVWNLFINSLFISGYQLSFKHGQKVMVLPECFNEIKKLQETEPTTLGIVIENGILINCHFFINSEIELDVSPGDIDSEINYRSLINFLHWLHSSLKKSVKLTHENAQTDTILYLN